MAAATVVDAVVHEAVHLVVGTDVMAVVAVATSATAWTVAGWLQAKAAAPLATHRSQLGAAALLIFGTLRPLSSVPVGLSTTAPRSLVAMAVTLNSALVVPVAVAAATFLLISGHIPGGRSAPWLAVSILIASAGAITTVLRVRACDGRQDWIARRGPHVGVAVVAGESLLLGSSVLVAAAVTHTENSVVSFLDIACAAVIARAVVLLRQPPAGALAADLTFFVLLTAVGTSTAASMAIVVVWRASSVVAWGLLRLARGRLCSGPPLALAGSPTGSATGEKFHRVTFRALGLFPARVRDGARRTLFDILFAISENPWAYDDLPYERRKRAHLLSHLPAHASVVVDVGCADGHVLAAIGRERPEALVIGVDISENAVRAARRRTAPLQNTVVVRGSVAEAAEAIRRSTSRPVDLLILSEVLYYLGSPAQVERDLTGLKPLLAPQARIILVHPEKDARGLHLPALDVLACDLVASVRMPDVDRPVVLDIGRPRATSQPSR